MFRDVISKLEETEKLIYDLKRDKAQAEHFLALVVSQIGEIEIDMNNLYKVDFKKVKLLPDENDKMKVKVFYDSDSKRK